MRWIICLFLFLATTISYIDRSVVALIEPMLHLPFMGWVEGVSPQYQTAYNNAYGDTVIAFQIAYGVGLAVAGRLIDKLGTKLGYAAAILIWTMASVGHSLITSLLGFCLVRVLLGLGEAGNFPAAIKAVADWFPTEERALATGLFNSGATVSFFVAPICVAAITQHFGWRAAFLFTGYLGLAWLAAWMLFPYNRLRRGSTLTQQPLQQVVPQLSGKALYGLILKKRGLYAFAISKTVTDPIWWFYLFYLPKYLNENYGLDLNRAKHPLIVVYSASALGSVIGGWFSGNLIKRGYTVNYGRKLTMLITALCVLPLMFVPQMHTLFPGNAWPAIGIFSLAAAAHQAWSANLYATPTDMFPSISISTVIGTGSACGAAGGVMFIWVVKHFFALHPLPFFIAGACSYLFALTVFQWLVPRLGYLREPEITPRTL